MALIASMFAMTAWGDDTVDLVAVLVVESGASASLAPEATVTVAATVRNDGTLASGAYTVAVYVSTDATITDEDILVGELGMSALAAGATVAQDVSCTLPSYGTGFGEIGSGVYYFGLRVVQSTVDADPSNERVASASTFVVQASGQRDLVAVSIAATASLDGLVAGGTFDAEAAVYNAGTAALGQYSVAVYVSVDGELDDADWLVGYMDVTGGLAGGTGATHTVPCALPPNSTHEMSITSGLYRLILLVDTPTNDANPGNETVAATTRFAVPATGKSDVVASGLQPLYGQDFLAAEDSFVLTAEVRNVGTQTSGAVSVTIYASADGVLDKADYKIGEASAGTIAAGGTAEVAVSCTLPGNGFHSSAIPSGVYRFILMIDTPTNDGNPANETLVDDDWFTVPVDSAVDVVALEVVPPIGQAGLAPGDSFSVGARIHNAGRDQADSISIAIFATADGRVDADDYLLGKTIVGPLAGVSTGEWEVACKLPANDYLATAIATGIYRFAMIVDTPTNDANPTNESVVASRYFTVPGNGVVDLVAHEVLPVPGQAGLGPNDAFPVRVRVRNAGRQTSGAFTIAVYVTPDLEVTPEDVPIGRLVVDSLAGMSLGSYDVPCEIPPNDLDSTSIPKGVYHFAFIIEQLEDDANTMNDRVATTEFFTVPNDSGVDLVALDLTEPPGQNFLGPANTFDVRAWVRNGGRSTSGTFLLEVYVSTDRNITAADLKIGELTVSDGLAGVTNMSYAVPCVLPPNGFDGSAITTGVYYYGLVVTPSTPDVNADNQTFVTQHWFTVPDDDGVDLAAHTVEPPLGLATYAPGETFNVVARVRNVGRSAAGSYTASIYASSDGMITDEDTKLGELSVDSLAALSGAYLVVPCQVPPNGFAGTAVAAGDYVVGLLLTPPATDSNAANDTCVARSGLELTGTAPAAPTGLGATATGPFVVSLTWTDNAGIETGYEVYRRTSGAAWSRLTTLDADSTSHADATVAAATLYEYYVRAVAADNGASLSGVVSVTTPEDAPLLAVTPTALDFGGVTVGETADLTVEVRNSGTGTLTGELTVAAPFSLVGDGTYSLATEATKTITLRFSPVAAGAASEDAALTGGGGATVALSGVGVAIQRTLVIVTAGDGTGTVTVNGSTVTLPYSAQWDDGSTLEIGAAGSADSDFTGFSGGLSGTTSPQTLTLNGDKSVTATFARQRGALAVSIEPQGAIDAGAQWSLDGGTTWRESGDTVATLPVGSYTVHFKAIADWDAPADEAITVTKDSTTTHTGTYLHDLGSLTVTLAPSGASDSGARWSVDDGTTWQVSGATVADLPTGDVVLTFLTIENYGTPADQTVTIAKDTTASANGTYTLYTNIVTVSLAPAAAIGDNARWSVDGGTNWHGDGESVGVPSGSATLTFQASRGWLAPIAKTVTVASNATTSASVIFVPLKGDFNGDSQSDLLWQSGSGAVRIGASTSSLSGGPALASSFPTELVLVPPAHSPWQGGRAAADFNGDTLNDAVVQDDRGAVAILLQRSSDGAFTDAPVWLYDGVLAGWRVAAAADFDGDGDPDILLQADSGAMALWYILDQELIGSAFLFNSPLPNWRVVGAADLDGDTDPDLVLQHSDGSIALWTLQNGTLASGTLVELSAEPAWRVVGIYQASSTTMDLVEEHSSSHILRLRHISHAVSTGTEAISPNPGLGQRVALVAPPATGSAARIYLYDASTTLTVWSLASVFSPAAGSLTATSVASVELAVIDQRRVVGTADWDGNGTPDVLWSDPAGRLGVTWMSGATATSSDWVDPSPTTMRAAGVGDLNKDGHADVLLQGSDGAVSVRYLVYSASQLQTGSLGSISGPLGSWSLVCVAQLGASNSSADLLFQHADGMIAYWELSNTALVSSGLIFGGALPGWHLRAAADMGGVAGSSLDGLVDLVLQHDTGDLAAWILTRSGSGPVSLARGEYLSAPGTGKRLAGAGFITTTAQADLFFQATRGGDLSIVPYAGTTAGSASVVSLPALYAENRTVVGTEDVNDDGYLDIVWTLGDLQIGAWLLDGSGACIGSPWLYDAAIPGWSAIGVMDFDGDSHSDILLRNSSGTIGLWRYANGSLLGGEILTPALSDWSPVGTADWDEDGDLDLFLQHTTTGDLIVWTYQDMAFTGVGQYLLTDLGTLKIYAIGDFDGDHSLELLLKAPDTGDVTIRPISGGSAQAVTVPAGYAPCAL